MDDEKGQIAIENGDAGTDFQPLERFNAFSDGVFAIVITLLVLELPVPASGEALLAGLAESWPDLLGYLLSFAFVGSIWLSHAGLTKFMKRGDPISFRLNLVVLLFVSLLPFTTKIMVSHMRGVDARAAATIYGLNLLVASTMLAALMVYAARDRQLIVDDVADNKLKQVSRHRRAALILNALAVIVALIAPNIAIGMYIIVAGMFIVDPLIRVRRSGKRT